MKQTLNLIRLILLSIALFATGNAVFASILHKEYEPSLDTVAGQIHPVVKHIFYDLPLEKSRTDIRNAILNDSRFVSTDTIFNNYVPGSFFKGITTDPGIIKSNPDSVQVMLFLGNTSLAIEKGGEAEFKDIMLVNCKYYFSRKEIVEMEYGNFNNLLYPILKDTSIGKSETPYFKNNSGGKMLITENIFESFKPYYRVGISSISMIPTDDSKSVYMLDIVFGKEDK